VSNGAVTIRQTNVTPETETNAILRIGSYSVAGAGITNINDMTISYDAQVEGGKVLAFIIIDDGRIWIPIAPGQTLSDAYNNYISADPSVEKPALESITQFDVALGVVRSDLAPNATQRSAVITNLAIYEMHGVTHDTAIFLARRDLGQVAQLPPVTADTQSLTFAAGQEDTGAAQWDPRVTGALQTVVGPQTATTTGQAVLDQPMMPLTLPSRDEVINQVHSQMLYYSGLPLFAYESETAVIAQHTEHVSGVDAEWGTPWEADVVIPQVSVAYNRVAPGASRADANSDFTRDAVMRISMVALQKGAVSQQQLEQAFPDEAVREQVIRALFTTARDLPGYYVFNTDLASPVQVRDALISAGVDETTAITLTNNWYTHGNVEFNLARIDSLLQNQQTVAIAVASGQVQIPLNAEETATAQAQIDAYLRAQAIAAGVQRGELSATASEPEINAYLAAHPPVQIPVSEINWGRVALSIQTQLLSDPQYAARVSESL
jgi:hypothetical protein